MNRISRLLHSFLSQPNRVFWICCLVVFGSLLGNGNLLHLYSLHREEHSLAQQMQETRASILQLDQQMRMAQDPSFIARQAVDRYDLAEENDLIFVFPED